MHHCKTKSSVIADCINQTPSENGESEEVPTKLKNLKAQLFAFVTEKTNFVIKVVFFMAKVLHRTQFFSTSSSNFIIPKAYGKTFYGFLKQQFHISKKKKKKAKDSMALVS